MGGCDTDGVGCGVFECVIERGGVDDARIRDRTAQTSDEIDIGGCVERPVDPTTVVCESRVVHGVELGAGEVPAVEPDEDRLGVACVEVLDETGGEGGFPGRGDAGDGDQETCRVWNAGVMSDEAFLGCPWRLLVELVDDELGALDEDVVHGDYGGGRGRCHRFCFFFSTRSQHEPEQGQSKHHPRQTARWLSRLVSRFARRPPQTAHHRPGSLAQGTANPSVQVRAQFDALVRL